MVSVWCLTDEVFVAHVPRLLTLELPWNLLKYLIYDLPTQRMPRVLAKVIFRDMEVMILIGALIMAPISEHLFLVKAL